MWYGVELDMGRWENQFSGLRNWEDWGEFAETEKAGE